MKKIFKIALTVLVLIAIGAAFALYVNTHDIDVLSPKGMIGGKEKDLIITASLLMLIVVIPVFFLTWLFAWKYREKNEKATHAPDWEHNYIAEYCWWGVPFVIVVILSIITWRSTHELNPFRPIENGKPPLTIQAVALEWKWLFIYPEQGVATLNYVEFPEKTPINFEITSDAPMNSFWIPQLGGQIYAMPAMRSKLHLIANEVGTYRGMSAAFSGKGFSGMRFKAHSSTPEDFRKWVSSVRNSGGRLGFAQYQELAKPSERNAPAYYQLSDPNLFDRIIEQYTLPAEKR